MGRSRRSRGRSRRVWVKERGDAVGWGCGRVSLKVHEGHRFSRHSVKKMRDKESHWKGKVGDEKRRGRKKTGKEKRRKKRGRERRAIEGIQPLALAKLLMTKLRTFTLGIERKV